MKCDGLPDPVCVRELNTYLCLWKEDTREEIDAVLERTLEVLPIMSTLGMTRSELVFVFLRSTPIHGYRGKKTSSDRIS